MKSDIIKLEKEYWDAMSNHDFDTVRGLTKFPCIVAGKRGIMSVDEPSYKEMFEQGKGKTTKVNNISNEQIQAGADHALIAYEIELNYDGQAMKCACTSTWVKENGKRLCAMHTESDLEMSEI